MVLYANWMDNIWVLYGLYIIIFFLFFYFIFTFILPFVAIAKKKKGTDFWRVNSEKIGQRDRALRGDEGGGGKKKKKKGWICTNEAEPNNCTNSPSILIIC